MRQRTNRSPVVRVLSISHICYPKLNQLSYGRINLQRVLAVEFHGVTECFKRDFMVENKTTKQSVLVVDDYDDIRDLMRARLEKLGYLVLEAADGKQAVELAEREHPDLILMDFNMPILDGFVATRYIRELDDMQDVPIVGLTAHGKEYSRSLAIASGCNDYLEKPIDFDHLDSVINRWLPKSAEPQT